jgi:GR25 family glycosyltransferase involved in LPS biosynthesis
MVNNCLIINMDERKDLWENQENFRQEWSKSGRIFHRISGTNYKNRENVLLEYIRANRIDLNGSGFRNNKSGFLGELGCYNSHYNCWKYVVDNKLDSCLIIEDGILFLRNDYNNLKMNKNLDLLFVNEEMTINPEKKYVGYGTQGYIVSLKGAEKLMKLCYTLRLPIDLHMRHLCNSKEINASVLSNPFVKRNNNRKSSIEELKPIDDIDLNAKQNHNPLFNRLISKLLEKNINLDDFI